MDIRKKLFSERAVRLFQLLREVLQSLSLEVLEMRPVDSVGMC